jgi:competence protein ComEC
VPHHGSLTSSSPAFLDALDPTVAIVSAGRDNRFGHPAPAVVRRYQEAGAVIRRTGRAGAIEVCSDGEDIRVRAAGDPAD